MKNIVYHGSNITVENPKIILNGHYKDFGYGFYCTRIENQAKRWALSKKNCSIVNKYEYTKNKKLSVKIFETMTDEWLEFVVSCRRGIEHNYDIVEGPMADDQIWNYVEDYVAGSITKEAFWELVKFRHPTNQIVFNTEDALLTLKYKGSEIL